VEKETKIITVSYMRKEKK